MRQYAGSSGSVTSITESPSLLSKDVHPWQSVRNTFVKMFGRRTAVPTIRICRLYSTLKGDPADIGRLCAEICVPTHTKQRGGEGTRYIPCTRFLSVLAIDAQQLLSDDLRIFLLLDQCQEPSNSEQRKVAVAPLVVIGCDTSVARVTSKVLWDSGDQECLVSITHDRVSVSSGELC